MDEELEAQLPGHSEQLQLPGHSEQLQLLGAELDRQRTPYSSRIVESNSRAAIPHWYRKLGAGFQMGALTSGW